MNKNQKSATKTPKKTKVKMTVEKKRFLAEIDNLRKNYAQRNLENMFYGQQKILTDLIAVLNSFEMSLQFSPQKKETQQFLQGMQIGIDMFYQILKKYGIKKIKTKIGDAYDSEFHEIIAQEFDTQKKEQTIIKITQNGYMLHERLLQPTKVVINKKKPKSTV